MGGDHTTLSAQQRKNLVMNFSIILSIIQLVIAVFLVVFILLQQGGTALGSAFGGGGGSFYGARRGIQQKLYWGTIVLGVLFVGLSLARLFSGVLPF